MTAVRWLSEREQAIWRTFMSTVLDFTTHLDMQLRRDAGMPVAYYEILVVLSEVPDRSLRMSRLAEFCNSSRSRLSHAVGVLEREGWVVRVASETDQRGAVARLTDAGFAALEAAAPQHVTEVRKHLFDVLTSEQLDTLYDISLAVQRGLTSSCTQSDA